ncbi:hypothetical protein AVEN_193175-1 [Araneus ventricosus]|uniref:Uncharacterized protein n=1 Tax=Araneus ventricosus TaxID=182803 RepID=A0A4Y2B362_ARAVE|nr:hypothetical protein AVEN_193175-1 [Araneus ventricosus]
MKPRHLNCLAHFGDPPDGSIDVRESVYMYLYKEKIAREHLTGPQHYPDNGLVSGTTGKVSRNQEEEVTVLSDVPVLISDFNDDNEQKETLNSHKSKSLSQV